MWPRRQLSWVPYKTVAKCKPDEGEIFVNVIMILVNVYASMMQRGGCSTYIKLCVYPRANSTISEWEVKYALETTDNLAFYCFCVSEFIRVWYWLRVWTVTSQDEGRALSFLLLSFWCCSSCGYCSSFADIALPGDVVQCSSLIFFILLMLFFLPILFMLMVLFYLQMLQLVVNQPGIAQMVGWMAPT